MGKNKQSTSAVLKTYFSTPELESDILFPRTAKNYIVNTLFVRERDRIFKLLAEHSLSDFFDALICTLLRFSNLNNNIGINHRRRDGCKHVGLLHYNIQHV